MLVTFLNGNSKSHARQIVRRLKRHKSSLRVGIVMPAMDGQPYKAIEADDVGADFVSSGLSDAVRSALTESRPVDVKMPVKRLAPQRLRGTVPLKG